jgi:2-keto-4-pentenoate hydratase
MSELAQAIAMARESGGRLDSKSADLTSVEQAYAVQERVRVLLSRRIAGWKVARTPDGEVISAPILDDAVFQAGGYVLQSRISHGFECELAFIVKHCIPAISRTEYTAEDVVPLLGEVSAAFELLSCRTEQGFQSPRPLLVADNLGNGGIVLGKARADWQKLELGQIKISLTIGGEKVAEKRGGNPIGNPVDATVLLANHLSRRQLSWEPGQIIMTGAFAGVHHANVGQHVEARFEGFSPVSMSVAAVQ